MKAGAAGGIETVLKATDVHIHSGACYKGLGALWSLTSNNCKHAKLVKIDNTNEYHQNSKEQRKARNSRRN